MMQYGHARWVMLTSLLVLVGITATYIFEGASITMCPPPTSAIGFASPEPVAEPWESSRVLNGLPTQKFKDNLRNDTWYITAWSNGGFTNQFMSYVNMVYLGIASGRVAIIPPFGPHHHIPLQAGTLSFGKIFNLTSARRTMYRPLLEWKEVKALPSDTSIKRVPPGEREQLGCWSGRQANDPKPSRVDSVVDHLQLDIAYTRVPTETRRDMSNKAEEFVDFHRIVPYIYPRRPHRPNPKGFPLMQESPLKHELPPDEKMSCFDHLYYATSSYERMEWQYSWSPAWGQVATHLRFTDELVDITKGYLARAFNTAEDDIPPFIAVHMRRGDFATRCKKENLPLEKCMPPLSVYKAKVDDIIQELLEKQGREVKKVVLMSDETDHSFWEEVKSIGWTRLDHAIEESQKKFGDWYPPIIDQVAHSMAAGFVGTVGSTFSLVGARRVEDWNNGYTAMIDRT